MRLTLAACFALATLATPAASQEFQGTARLRWLLVRPDALVELGATTPAQVFAIPAQRLRALAESRTQATLVPVTVSVRSPRLRMTLGEGAGLLHLLLDYRAATGRLVSPAETAYADLAPDDPILETAGIFALLLPLVSDTAAGPTVSGSIDGVPARALDLVDRRLHMRIWLARRASATDWAALGRTVSALQGVPLAEFPRRASDWSPLQVQMLPVAYPAADAGLVVVDFLRVEKAAVPVEAFALPPGARRVELETLANPFALQPRAADTTIVLLDAAGGDSGLRRAAGRGDSVLREALVDTRPTVIRCPPARYPPTARLAAIQGRVVVQLIVDRAGRPEPGSLIIVESPHDSLSTAAREMALGCVFTPARVHGLPVRVLIRLPLDFRLRPDTTRPLR